MSKVGSNVILKKLIVYIVLFFAVRLPIPAYLLALSFFFLSLLSFSMVVGLRTKRTRQVSLNIWTGRLYPKIAD